MSRFFSSEQRNNPAFWLFLSLVCVPLYIYLRSIISEVPHFEIVIVSVLGISFSFLPLPKIFQLLPNTKTRYSIAYTIPIIIIATIFFLGLILAKQELLVGYGETSVKDDLTRVQVVISTGRSLASPSAYNNITKPLAYHHYDYLLPGVIFRLTSLSAQQSWFVHNVLEYAAALWLIAYVGMRLFTTAVGKISFVLMSTIAGGGLDYFIYRIRGDFSTQTNFSGLQIELWSNRLSSLNPSGLRHEILSPYYLQLWNPHHMLAGSIFLFIVILLISEKRTANRLLASSLAGIMIGFSIFVFITSFLSLLASELYFLFSIALEKLRVVKKTPQLPFPKEPEKVISSLNIKMIRKKTISLILIALVFGFFSIPTLFNYTSSEKEISTSNENGIFYVKSLRYPLTSTALFQNSPFAQSLPEFSNNFLKRAEKIVAPLYTILLIYFVDLGVIAALAIILFFTIKQSEEPIQRALYPRIFFGCLVTTIVIFSIQNETHNDIFRAGAIVMQICATIAAAKSIDYWKTATNKAWFIIPVLLLFNSFNFFHGLATAIQQSPPQNISAINRAVWTQTPKNSIVYSNTVCHKRNSNLYLNRHCQPATLTELRSAIKTNGLAPEPAYFLSSQKVNDPLLVLQTRQKEGDEVFLYKIEK